MKLPPLRGLDRGLQALTGPLGALGLALGLALLCGLLVESRTLGLAAALATALALGLGYPWLAVRAAAGELRFDALRVREGEPLTARVALTNRSPLPLWGLKVVGVAETDGEETLALRPRESREFVQTLAAPPRGRYPERAPALTCVFPFGLSAARRPLACAQEALVWPSVFPAPDVPESGEIEALDGTVPSRKAGTSGDLIGVRDFRRGDSLRRIHWAQTARHERLIVTERQALRLPSVRITLDLTGAQGGPDSEREWAIRAAMSLIEDWTKKGVRLEVIVRDGGATRLPAGRDARRDALARLPRLSPERPTNPLGAMPGAGDASATALVTTVSGPREGGADLLLLARAGGLAGGGALGG